MWGMPGQICQSDLGRMPWILWLEVTTPFLSLFLPRSVAPKPISGLSNPLFYTRDSSLPAKNRPPDPSETVSTNQPPRPIVKPKRPPPAPPGAVSSSPLPVPVYAPKIPNQFRPDPPTKPLPELKPKQVKPTFAPPTPPVKPGTGGTVPGATQGAGEPKVALKVPIQKR